MTCNYLAIIVITVVILSIVCLDKLVSAYQFLCRESHPCLDESACERASERASGLRSGDGSWRNATFSGFPLPLMMTSFPSLAVCNRREFFVRPDAYHVYPCKRRSGVLNNNTRFLEPVRSREHKIVRVSHDIIISGTKNGISIIRTGALML